MAQRIFVTCMMLFGAFLYGYIIGAVSAILSSAGDHRHKFITTMNKLNAFMENRMLPAGLRCQLRHYFRCALATRCMRLRRMITIIGKLALDSACAGRM